MKNVRWGSAASGREGKGYRVGTVYVVGSINMDLVYSVKAIPKPGETVSSTSFQRIPGGKGANQAVGMARQGVPVKMVARLGADGYGRELRSHLKDNGVNTEAVLDIAGVSTGTAVIFVDESGENCIVLHDGANGQLSAADLRSASAGGDKPAAIVAQLEVPTGTVEAAAEIAGDLDIPFILNPAPAGPLPASIFAHTTYLIPNVHEAEVLSGMNIGADLDRTVMAGRKLLSKGCRFVVITLGGQGAVWVHGEEAVHIAAPAVEVVDTTAAGDAFIGGFVAALVAGADVTEAVTNGCRCGALTCTKRGAQPSLPTREALARFRTKPAVHRLA